MAGVTESTKLPLRENCAPATRIKCVPSIIFNNEEIVQCVLNLIRWYLLDCNTEINNDLAEVGSTGGNRFSTVLGIMFTW